jgi:hypothetical protein
MARFFRFVFSTEASAAELLSSFYSFFFSVTLFPLPSGKQVMTYSGANMSVRSNHFRCFRALSLDFELCCFFVTAHIETKNSRLFFPSC